MLDLEIEFKLNRIRCHREADGAGGSSPDLCVVFFKLDGDTLVIDSSSSAAFLQGEATLRTAPCHGRHQHKPRNASVGEGEDLRVPAIIGEYRTILKPIPLAVPLTDLSAASGMLGCAVMLTLEDGGRPDKFAIACEAFETMLRDRLVDVRRSLRSDWSGPDRKSGTSFADRFGKALEEAIGDRRDAFESLAGSDLDTGRRVIGSAIFAFSHARLEDSDGVAIPFGRRWAHHGDWELFGHVEAAPVRRDESLCRDDTVPEILVRMPALPSVGVCCRQARWKIVFDEHRTRPSVCSYQCRRHGSRATSWPGFL